MKIHGMGFEYSYFNFRLSRSLCSWFTRFVQFVFTFTSHSIIQCPHSYLLYQSTSMPCTTSATIKKASARIPRHSSHSRFNSHTRHNMHSRRICRFHPDMHVCRISLHLNSSEFVAASSHVEMSPSHPSCSKQAVAIVSQDGAVCWNPCCYLQSYTTTG